MGKYVNTHLIKDESVVFETRYHWVIFLTLRSLLTLTIAPAIQRALSEFVITNRRIIIKTGFIARSTFEMNLSKIESVNVDQSVAGRIFNYGSLTIIGTGGTRETFNNISKPLSFRKAFQELC
ncbi:MAG: PH domain-containing protein [Methanosarcina sp.]|nr:PH domain-containing protein [Methanosarcina sp.]